ncbi:MAG: hypothetical protein FH749_04315 [Firmicutes bacterium]|nr:hypothetical protein [Bacillota bacterium]
MSGKLGAVLKRLFMVALVAVMVLSIVYSIQFYRVTDNVQRRFVLNSQGAYAQLSNAIRMVEAGSLHSAVWYLTDARTYAFSNHQVLSESGIFSGVWFFKPVSHEAIILTDDTIQAVDSAMTGFYNGSGELNPGDMARIEQIREKYKAFLDYIDISSEPSYFTLRRKLRDYASP